MITCRWLLVDDVGWNLLHKIIPSRIACFKPDAVSAGRGEPLDKAEITGEKVSSVPWEVLIMSILGDRCWITPSTVVVGEHLPCCDACQLCVPKLK